MSYKDNLRGTLWLFKLSFLISELKLVIKIPDRIKRQACGLIRFHQLLQYLVSFFFFYRHKTPPFFFLQTQNAKRCSNSDARLILLAKYNQTDGLLGALCTPNGLVSFRLLSSQTLHSFDYVYNTSKAVELFARIYYDICQFQIFCFHIYKR